MYGQSTGLQAHLRPGALELGRQGVRGQGSAALAAHRIGRQGASGGTLRRLRMVAGAPRWPDPPTRAPARPSPGLKYGPLQLRAVDLRFSTKPSAPRARTCARIYGLQGLTDTAFSAVPYLYGLLLFGPLYGHPALYGPPLSPLMGERTTLRSILLPPLPLAVAVVVFYGQRQHGLRAPLNDYGHDRRPYRRACPLPWSWLGRCYGEGQGRVVGCGGQGGSSQLGEDITMLTPISISYTTAKKSENP